jgi:hypothetical protein
MNLPRDLELAVIRRMDIDTRRALGIYARLRVPSDIQNKLSACLGNRPFAWTAFASTIFARVCLGKKYELVRTFENDYYDEWVFHNMDRYNVTLINFYR